MRAKPYDLQLLRSASWESFDLFTARRDWCFHRCVYRIDKWIEQLEVEGITGGCGVGTYCPDADVTRAQMAVFLVKTFALP